MVDDSVCVPQQALRETNQGLQPTLIGERAPLQKRTLSPAFAAVTEQPFQLVLENVSNAQGPIDFQQGVEALLLVGLEVVGISQKQIPASLDKSTVAARVLLYLAAAYRV